ncbi:MAG: AgmX/PglI C-terminal domain-containing protein [Deltaproteobacteria bacterium]|nr:AgmX/PglI C-terminal domain-containing protein [Deltaproteobacteria bacterium]
MGKSVYRRGAPVLAVGAAMSVLGVAWLAASAALEAKLAPPPKSTTSTTSDFKLPDDPWSPPPLEPLAAPGDPKSIRVPVVTQPAGAAVYEVDNGRRRQLCAATPCEIPVWKSRIDQMLVSLELTGFDPVRAHVKDVTEVPGGSLQMVFTRAYTSVPLGGRRVGSPILRQGKTVVDGTMPPEVIQRIVRQNFGRFRLCYENALVHDATLAGRITVRFVIALDGSSSGATASGYGSDIGDQKMIDCVVKAFGNLSFPMPEGRPVTVTYPISFNPGEA